MKICNQCQAENPDTLEICEACGARLEPAEELAEPAEEIAEAVEETAEEPVEAAEETGEAPAEQPEKKKTSTAALVAIVVAIVAVIALIIGVSQSKQKAEEMPAEAPAAEETVKAAAAHHTNAHGLPSHSIHFAKNEDGTFSYSYMNEAGETVAVTEEELQSLLDQEIASCAGQTLNNRQMMFFYDDQKYSFSTMYSSYLSFMMNTEQALDEQVGMDGANTWEQMFVTSGIQMFHQIAAVSDLAKSEGHTLTEEQQAAVDNMEAQLDTAAATYGFENAETYLQAYFGPAARLEDYLTFYANNVFVNSYLASVEAGITNTPEELEAYYDENAETMVNTYGVEKDDRKMVSVRHILIQPEATVADDGTSSITEEAWAAAEAQANEIYEQFQNVDPSESYFAGLAAMYSSDPGSQSNGGLYENVYPGQMVAEFNDWCFAEGRAAGDHGIVKTSYGYHIMFFSAVEEQAYWEKAANDMLLSQKMNDFIANAMAVQPLTADQSKVVLLNSIVPTVPAAETEEAAQ